VARRLDGDDPTVTRSRFTDEEVHVLACAECPRVSSATAKGWRAVRTDVPSEDELPLLAFYCPACAQREFDE
jgi:hypothetical protein